MKANHLSVPVTSILHDSVLLELRGHVEKLSRGGPLQDYYI